MLKTENTALILIDYQGKLAAVMDDQEELHRNMLLLVKGAQLLEIPIIWLEQYPKGLGPTENEVKELLEADDYRPIAKTTFSGVQHADFRAALEAAERKNILVAGIEAHICVYQTVCELLGYGKRVEFVQDAISSRTAANTHLAIEQMKALGALPTSVEMALFELMRTSKHPKFKEISKLIQ